MRASALVYVTIAGLALVAGCGSEKKPSEDSAPQKAAAPKAASETAPKPVTSVANVEKSELTPPPPAEEQAIEPKDTAADEKGPAEEAAEPGEIELVETEGISLAELVIARGVEKRQPVEPGQRFSLADGPKLYAVMLVNNPDKIESEVTVSWQQGDGDKERGGVTVKVGAQPRWRTWAYHSYFKKPGNYVAVVRDAGGQVIGRAPFVLTD